MRKSVEEQVKIITKGVDTIVDVENLKEKLIKSERENRPLIIKLGLAPSTSDIHLGHAVVLRKIKQMQDLGHHAVIVIGDFTGKIGDPTGKPKGRVSFTDEQVKANALTYRNQLLKILDREQTEVRYNSEWLAKLSFEDVIRLSAPTTIARILERDDFQNRYRNNISMGIHEIFYPIMQGYDSVALKADIELGGTDQIFNTLFARTLQKSVGGEQQVAIFMPILEGLDGVEKMSKSLENYISVNEDASLMFKKVMEVPDKLIIKYFELATDEHPDTIEEVRRDLENGKNSKDVKFQLAQIITRIYHGDKSLKEAMSYYDAAFRKKEKNNIPELVIEQELDKLIHVIPLLVEGKLVSSIGEFTRLVSGGCVQINLERVTDLELVLYSGDVIKIGKKRFVRIIK